MKGPRVGIYTLRFPKSSETWAVTKVVGLLDAGVDVQVFSRWEGDHWDRFQVFQDRPELRRRVHFLPDDPYRSWSVRTVLAVAALVVRTARQDPREFARYLEHNWRWRDANGLGFWRGVYERLPFVGQRLDILHLELDTMAPGVSDIKHYLGCRLVLSGRSTLQYTGNADRWPGGYHLLFDLVDAYHVETEHTRRNLHGLGLDPSIPIWMIRSAIDARGLFVPDPPDVRRRRAVGEPLRVLSVCRLQPEKGLEFGLQAVALVHTAGVPITYTIVGEGAHDEALRVAAHQLGLDEAGAGIVSFAGGVAREAMVEHYRQADVLLHPSTDEGLPNVPLEAQAMELPVVTTDAGGNPDAVAAGVSGFVVPARDAGALAAALTDLAGDPDLGLALGRAGRQRILDGFDARDWIPQYVQRYRELAATDTLLDVVFVVAPQNRGWILEGICKEIDAFVDGRSAFHYGPGPLPRARAYFFSHYLLFFDHRRDRALRQATTLVWFTHPGYPADEAGRVARQLSAATWIVSGSSMHADDLVAAGLLREKVAVVVPGADPGRFRPHRRGDGAVGFCSAFQPRKNPGIVVELVEAMPERRFRLLGRSWPEAPEFERLLARPNFEYVEAGYDDYPAFYDGVDVLVSPSLLEGGPIPLLEAMMANVVPVATDTGFARDLIRHGENGYLCPVDAPVSTFAELVDAAYALPTDVRSTVDGLTWERFARAVLSLGGCPALESKGSPR